MTAQIAARLAAAVVAAAVLAGVGLGEGQAAGRGAWVAGAFGLGNLAGVKESTGNCEQVQEMVDRGIPVISGDDHYTFPFMALRAEVGRTLADAEGRAAADAAALKIPGTV